MRRRPVRLLLTHILLRLALAIADRGSLAPSRAQSAGTKLVFYPFVAWPWSTIVGANFNAGEPDVIWMLPRELAVGVF